MTNAQIIQVALQVVWPWVLGYFAGWSFARAQIAERNLKRVTAGTRILLFAYEQGNQVTDQTSPKEIEALHNMQASAARCAKTVVEVFGDKSTKKLDIKKLTARELKENR